MRKEEKQRFVTLQKISVITMKRVFFIILSSMLFCNLYTYGEVLDNQAIIDMVKMGLSDDVILAKILTDANSFDTSVQALKVLVDNKVSNTVIESMVLAADNQEEKADREPVSTGKTRSQKSAYKRDKNNQDVIDMVQAKIDERTINQKVLLTEVEYDTSLPAILDLLNNGVTERVIGTMMYHSKYDPSLNNQGVIELVQAGISERIINQKVLLAIDAKFDMGTDAIKYLKKNGVSDRIIQTMMYHAE